MSKPSSSRADQVAVRARGRSFEPAVARAFGLTVRDLRLNRGLAQDAFALRAQIDRSYFGKLERGERQPSLGLLLRIAHALDVSGAELIRATEEKIVAERGGAAGTPTTDEPGR